MTLSELQLNIKEHLQDLHEQESILMMPGSTRWSAPSAVTGTLRIRKPEGCATWMEMMLGMCKTKKQLEDALRKHLDVLLEHNPDSYLAELMIDRGDNDNT